MASKKACVSFGGILNTVVVCPTEVAVQKNVMHNTSQNAGHQPEPLNDPAVLQLVIVEFFIVRISRVGSAHLEQKVAIN